MTCLPQTDLVVKLNIRRYRDITGARWVGVDVKLKVRMPPFSSDDCVLLPQSHFSFHYIFTTTLSLLFRLIPHSIHTQNKRLSTSRPFPIIFALSPCSGQRIEPTFFVMESLNTWSAASVIASPVLSGLTFFPLIFKC